MSGSMETRRVYETYLKSSRWRNTRVDLMKMRGASCESCEARPLSLEVHHLNYDRLGHELPGDLQVLCKRCHQLADEKRRKDLQRDFERQCEERRVRNAFETWYEKVHGNSASYATCSDVEDFNDWLERKESEA